jgi:hypothetical protein
MISARDLGAAASATFGGLFRAYLVGVTTPAVVVDIVSTYPTMFSLLGLTAVYACQRFDSIEGDPDELRDMLSDPECWWERATWARWGLTFVVIRPHGEWLPSRAEFGGGSSMTVAPLDLAGGTACFHWADLVAAVRRGADPAWFEVVRVFTLSPVGVQPGLGPVRLPTGRLVDLAGEDLGAAVIQERQRAQLAGPPWLAGLMKAVGSAVTYGLLARTDVRQLPKPTNALAHGPGGEALTVTTRSPERQGPHAFLPAAAAVAAAGRLILAMAEGEVTRAGWVVAAVHADSLTIAWPPTPAGQRAELSEADLRQVLYRFAGLGIRFGWEVPAQAGSIGVVLGVNRAVHTTRTPDDGWHMVRSSDAGLGGHLADPSDTPGARRPDGRWQWAADCELAIVQTATTAEPPPSEYGPRVHAESLPAWATRPVARRYRADSWTALRHVRRQSADPSIQPFARYLRAGSAGPIAVGPWWDAKTWPQADWRMDGLPVHIHTLDTDGHLTPPPAATSSLIAVVPSIAAHVQDWANPEDAAMGGPRRGPRHPIPIWSTPELTLVVGKDGTELAVDDEDPDVGVDDGRLRYGALVDPALRDRARALGLRELSRRAGITFETLRKWAAGGQTSPDNLALITQALDAPDRRSRQAPEACALPGCPDPARPRSRWCCDAHRKAGRRRASKTAADLPATLPVCPRCGTRFINPRAAELHQCKATTS